MQKFIETIREFKKTPENLKPKLVWDSTSFIVVIFFSNKFIESRGMEVVCEKR